MGMKWICAVCGLMHNSKLAFSLSKCINGMPHQPRLVRPHTAGTPTGDTVNDEEEQQHLLRYQNSFKTSGKKPSMNRKPPQALTESGILQPSPPAIASSSNNSNRVGISLGAGAKGGFYEMAAAMASDFQMARLAKVPSFHEPRAEVEDDEDDDNKPSSSYAADGGDDSDAGYTRLYRATSRKSVLVSSTTDAPAAIEEDDDEKIRQQQEEDDEAAGYTRLYRAGSRKSVNVNSMATPDEIEEEEDEANDTGNPSRLSQEKKRIVEELKDYLWKLQDQFSDEAVISVLEELDELTEEE